VLADDHVIEPRFSSRGARLGVRDGSVRDSLEGASAETRFALFVLTVLAITAVLLTAVGVYGVVAERPL